MSGRARPRPLGRVRRKPRANRVQLHVARTRQEIILIHRERGEPALPQKPAPPLAEIDTPRIVAVQPALHRRQRILVRRHEDEVDVVRHQTIGEHLDIFRPAARGKAREVSRVVLSVEESLLTEVAAARVMWCGTPRATALAKRAMLEHNRIIGTRGCVNSNLLRVPRILVPGISLFMAEPM